MLKKELIRYENEKNTNSENKNKQTNETTHEYRGNRVQVPQ